MSKITNTIKPYIRSKFQSQELSYKLLFVCVIISMSSSIIMGQNYSTQSFSFSFANLKVENFPDLVSGTQSGYKVTYPDNSSSGQGILSAPGQYHKVSRGTMDSFKVNLTLLPGSYLLDVDYISEYGTFQQEEINLETRPLFNFLQSSEVITIYFTPPKGSLGDIIFISLSDQDVNNPGTFTLELPIVSEGIIDSDVAAEGRFLVPQTPQVVLHDPPGDKSFATFSTEDSYCRIEKNIITNADGKGGTATIQRGFSGSGGPVVAELNIETTIAATGTFNYNTTRINEDEYETCVTTTTSISTSKDLIGRAGDLFIGYGIEYEYGTYDLVEVVGTEFVINSGLVVVPDQNTLNEFFYTTQDIEVDIELQRSIFQNPTKTIREREIAFNQINVWQNILDRNDDILNNQPYDETPINWTSSSGEGSKTITIDRIQTYSTSSEVVIDGGLEITATALVAGNGIYGGPKFTWTTTTTNDTTEINGNSHTISYTLDDDDDSLPDNFQTLVGSDPDYGTPIFKLKPTSRTSCTYEGGIRRDRPRIFVNENGNECPVIFRDNIPAGNDVVIPVTICNDNPTELRSFHLYLENNINSATVSFGGKSFNNLNYAELGALGDIPMNSCKTVPIPLIIQKNANFNQYNDLRFFLYPKCLSGDPLPITTIRSEGAELNVSVTFGGSGNYPTDNDCDGIADAVDDCLDMPNGDDIDCDGIVDAEDPCPLDDSNSDSDGDQIFDCVDYCPNDINGSLNFDRIVPGPDNGGDYIEVNHHPDLNLPQNDFTISSWVYPTDDFYKTIVSKGDGFAPSTLYILAIWDGGSYSQLPEANGKLGLYMSGTWKFSNNVILRDTWTHVAVSFKKATQTVEYYINGNLDVTHTYTTTLNIADNQSMYISRQGRSANYHGFHGSMDELSLWNRALTTGDINLLKNGSLAGSEFGLAAYYKFNDHQPCIPNGPTTIIDSGPNNLASTLMNFDLATNTNQNNEPCESNWSTGRNEDSDDDDIGDDCQIVTCLGSDADSDGHSDCVDLCPNTNDTALNFGSSGIAFINGSQNYDFTDGTFSITAWINPHLNALAAILFKENVIDLFIDSNTGDDRTCKWGLRLEPNLPTVETQFALSTIPTNEWTHIAVTFSQGEVTFYINGSVDRIVSFGTHNFNVNPFAFTSFFGGGNYTVDDLTAWEKSLSQTEVNAIMNAPLVGNESDLLIYYDFNGETPCGSDATRTTVLSRKIGGDNANLVSFNLDGTCQSNWTYSHNLDSDGDGIGNTCGVSQYQCAISTVDSDGDGLQDCLDLCPGTANIGLDFRDSDGINDYFNHVEVPHHQDLNLLNGNFTLSAWIKPEGVNDNPILMKGTGFADQTLYYFFINGDGGLPQHANRIGILLGYPNNNEYRYSRSEIPKHQWSHVAVTFDFVQKLVTFYINGEIDGVPQAFPMTPLSNNNNQSLYIGSRGAGGRNFEGVLDEITIWNRKLSTSQIQNAIVEPLIGNEQNLIAHYKFDDGTVCGANAMNTTLQNYSSNEHHGTLNQFDLTSCFSNWTTGRNTDADGDGQGDECDDGIDCVPDYAGIRSLTTTINTSGDYETNGVIESTQTIDNPAQIDYDSGSSILLSPGFEVKAGPLFHAFIDGCSGSQ